MNETCIVTGASSGIGRATAIALAERGRSVICVARSGDALQALKTRYPEQVEIVCADLCDSAGISAVIESVKFVEHVDVLVHAAGSTVALRHYQDLQMPELLNHMGLHVSVPIELNNRLKNKLTGSRILYMDSHSAITPREGWSEYFIVKAAAQMAARSAMIELDRSSVIRVFPGGVRTALVEQLLMADSESPTVVAFKALDASGGISEPAAVGRFVANILLDATDLQLQARQTWDFNNPEDHVAAHSRTTR